jgi:(S)-sulfolactate dehydrogenase
MKVVIAEVMDKSAVESLCGKFDVVYDQDLYKDAARMVATLRDADGLIVKEKTQVSKKLLADAGRLKVVGRLGAGLDNIDVEECRMRGIQVFPASGANADSVAEYTLCMALLLLRPNAYAQTERVVEGAWPQVAARGGRELRGKVFGILGFGHVGRRIATLAGAFGATVLVLTPPRSKPPRSVTGSVAMVTLEELLARADVVSVNLPLNEETRLLMSGARIRAMKAGAILINTSRGGIVDETALAQALKKGNLSGAAVDVFAQEPLAKGSVFENVPHLVLSPHIAGGTVESSERRGKIIAEAVAVALLAGEGGAS